MSKQIHKRLVHRYFNNWYNAYQYELEQNLRVKTLRKSLAISKIRRHFSAWQGACLETQMKLEIASQHHEKSGLKCKRHIFKTWNLWKSVRLAKEEKISKVKSALDSSRKQRIITAWRQFVDNKIQYREAVVAVKKLVLGNVFNKWKLRTVESYNKKV